MNVRGPLRIGELLISIAMILLGAFICWQTQAIPEVQGYAQVGPRLFPYLIGIGANLCGIALGWQAFLGGWRNVSSKPEAARPDWFAFGTISMAIVLHMALIGWAGFVLASSLLFVLIARAFGSTRLVRDLCIAAALSIAAFLLFTLALGLNLPTGPINWEF